MLCFRQPSASTATSTVTGGPPVNRTDEATEVLATLQTPETEFLATTPPQESQVSVTIQPQSADVLDTYTVTVPADEATEVLATSPLSDTASEADKVLATRWLHNHADEAAKVISTVEPLTYPMTSPADDVSQVLATLPLSDSASEATKGLATRWLHNPADEATVVVATTQPLTYTVSERSPADNATEVLVTVQPLTHAVTSLADEANQVQTTSPLSDSANEATNLADEATQVPTTSLSETVTVAEPAVLRCQRKFTLRSRNRPTPAPPPHHESFSPIKHCETVTVCAGVEPMKTSPLKPSRRLALKRRRKPSAQQSSGDDIPISGKKLLLIEPPTMPGLVKNGGLTEVQSAVGASVAMGKNLSSRSARKRRPRADNMTMGKNLSPNSRGEPRSVGNVKHSRSDNSNNSHDDDANDDDNNESYSSDEEVVIKVTVISARSRAELNGAGDGNSCSSFKDYDTNARRLLKEYDGMQSVDVEELFDKRNMTELLGSSEAIVIDDDDEWSQMPNQIASVRSTLQRFL